MRHMRSYVAAIMASIILMLIMVLTLPITAIEPIHKNVSDEYLLSQYHANLNSLELTADQRTNVILVALTQLGYHEGNSDADMGGGNSSGTRNFVEYNRLFGKVDNSEGTGISYGYAWCCSFATWCIRQAGVPTTILKNEVSNFRLIEWLKANSTYNTRESGYIPTTADLIFFKNPTSSMIATHVGLVRYVSGNTVYTIEGNSSDDNVSLRSYNLSDTYIVGYGVPAYESNPAAAIDFSMSQGYLLGTYFINTAILNVRKGPSTSHEIISSLAYGDKVTVLATSANWGRINYEGGEGWIYLEGYTHYMPNARYTIFYDTNGGAPIVPSQPKADGVNAKLTTATPEKAGYNFIGWSTDPEASIAKYTAGADFAVNADTTLYAVWTFGEFMLRFYNGETLLLSNVYANGTEVTPPPAPDAPSDNTYAYTFAGWDKNADGIADILPGDKILATANADYHAVFNKAYIEYKVIFYDGDGLKIISEQTYHYGEPVEIPEVSNYSQGMYSYTFAGWDSTVAATVTENTTYTATYETDIAEYSVSFIDGNGNLMQSDKYQYEEIVTPPANTPLKNADTTFTYTFVGWDSTPGMVYGDTVYTALFDCIYIEYTISFVDGDGNTIHTFASHYGDTVAFPNLTPTKSSDLMYEYIFTDWDGEPQAVSKDRVYTAEFDSVLREYTVTFFNADETVYHTAKYNYGEVITPPEDPVRTSTSGTYTFAGWTPEISPVSGNMSFTAEFDFTAETTTGAIDDPNSGLTTGTIISIVIVLLAAGGFVLYIVYRGRRAGHEEP